MTRCRSNVPSWSRGSAAAIMLRNVVMAAALACTAGTASGQWPTDPGSPLVLGGIQGVGSVEHATAVTPDGATWAAWIDMQCEGALRVQRISPDGSLLIPDAMAIDPQPGCLGTDALLAACADGSVVVSRLFGPVQRIAADGAALWGSGLPLTGATIGAFLGLEDGDVLIAWHLGFEIFVGRYAVDGTLVWSEPASFPNMSGPNMRIFGLVSDGDEGAFVLWDSPGKYTRRIRAARVTGEGDVPWEEPLLIMPSPPGSSRHTDPTGLADGSGGVLVVWTEGAEQEGAVVPLLMQRITADGSMLLEPPGQRISLEFTRQFDPVLARDATSGDIFVMWRDGLFDEMALHVQRLTLSGDRLWGDGGVEVAALPISFANRFDGVWDEDTLKLAVVGEPLNPADASVKAYRVDGSGAVAPERWHVSDSTPAGAVQVAALDDAIAVTWVLDGPSFSDLIVAQRINDDGTLGLPPMPGDLDGDGVVGFADLVALLGFWGPCSKTCAADLDGDGLVGFGDLLVLLSNWG